MIIASNQILERRGSAGEGATIMKAENLFVHAGLPRQPELYPANTLHSYFEVHSTCSI